jgi:hypothetical protein
MTRLAAHYILLPDDRLLKQHYVEMDNENRLLGAFPLDKEIANTRFYNGVLMLAEHAGEIEIYLIDRLDLLPPKFSARDCRECRGVRKLGC